MGCPRFGQPIFYAVPVFPHFRPALATLVKGALNDLDFSIETEDGNQRKRPDTQVPLFAARGELCLRVLYLPLDLSNGLHAGLFLSGL